MQTVTYQSIVQATIETIKLHGKVEGKWKSTGASVAAFFKTKEAFTEVKAQYIADAVIPGIDKKHGDALAKELPRKKSKEYNELDATGIEAWEKATKAKAVARSVADTMFARVLSYAFPEEKEPQQTEKATPETLDAELITKYIKGTEKGTRAYDIVKAQKLAKELLAVITGNL